MLSFFMSLQRPRHTKDLQHFYGINISWRGRQLRKIISKSSFVGAITETPHPTHKVEQHWVRLRVSSTTGRGLQGGSGPAVLATRVCSPRGWLPCDLGQSTGRESPLCLLLLSQPQVPTCYMSTLRRQTPCWALALCVVSSGTHLSGPAPKHMPTRTGA